MTNQISDHEPADAIAPQMETLPAALRKALGKTGPRVRQGLWLAAGIAVAASVISAPSQAAYIGSIPVGTAPNDFISTYVAPGALIEGWFASNLYLTGDPAAITVQVFGGEAGYLNAFALGSYIYPGATGDTIANVGPSSLGAEDAIASGAFAHASGLLDFSFLINGLLGVLNGSNTDVAGTPSFFVALDNNYVFDTGIDGSTAGTGSSVFLFLDDAGANGDADHDDLVVRLTAQGGTFWVPEPASLGLLGIGLIGIGLVRGRRARRT